jgi:acetyl-CoA acyltransferase
MLKDIAIVSSKRTPIGRGKKGAFANVRPDTLGGVAVKAVLDDSGYAPQNVEDIIVGCAMPEGEQGMNVARTIGYLGGLPLEASAATINRFCSSGLHAVNDIAKSIAVGEIDVGIAGGAESMSLVPMGGYKPAPHPALMNDVPGFFASMGITAENIASRYDVSRQSQDEFALESHLRALRAQENGWFDDEICPVDINGTLISKDEGPRAGSTLEALMKLRPAFHMKGSVTAGNSSQVSDGAAAALMMTGEKAKAEGLGIMGYFRAFYTVGVDPEVMGIGPVPAVQKLLSKTGLSVNDIGVFELNEAFAAQAIYCMRELGIDHEKVNPVGGAIALGHPLGCTGARQVATILREMKRRDAQYGICTMCIGGGQGAAALIERA